MCICNDYLLHDIREGFLARVGENYSARERLNGGRRSATRQEYSTAHKYLGTRGDVVDVFVCNSIDVIYIFIVTGNRNSILDRFTRG